MGKTSIGTQRATCAKCGKPIERAMAPGEKWVHNYAYPGHPGTAERGTVKTERMR